MATVTAITHLPERVRAFVQRRPAAPRAIDADVRSFVHPVAGRVTTYEDVTVEGTPLLLVHAPEIGASAADMKPIFDAFRDERPVVAVDLPGFGASERAPSRVDRAVYHDVMTELFERLLRRHAQAADVVALGLSSELVAAAARRNEELVRSIVLLSPTGFSFRRRGPVDRATANIDAARLRRVLGHPILGRALYSVLSSRFAVRRRLARAFAGAVDERMVDVAHGMANQPDAWRVPSVVLTGALADPEVRDRVYRHLTVPALVVYDQSAKGDFEALGGFLRAEPTWNAERIRPTKGMPHFECPEDTFAVMRRFFNGLDVIARRELEAERFEPTWS